MLMSDSPQNPIRVLAWSEVSEPKYAYPRGIHTAIAEYLDVCEGITAKTANLDDPNQGVSDETVERIVRHVRERGMGFLGLHSTHFARPYKALMGTSCAWRCYIEDGKSGHIRVVTPDHPIAAGVQDFVIPHEEWYGEPYDVPEPEAVILEGHYVDGQEIVRDGLVWTVGPGRVFYFRPGHETFPIYYMAPVRKILENAVRWLAGRT
jgi:trehalose utilization protein